MDFITGQLCTPDIKKDIYEVTAEFDDGNDLQILTKDKTILELLIRTYDTYETNLSSNWNGYCNPDACDVGAYLYQTALEMGIDDAFDEDACQDSAYEYWALSIEYDCFARFEDCSIIYHDSNGLEHEVEIVRD